MKLDRISLKDIESLGANMKVLSMAFTILFLQNLAYADSNQTESIFLGSCYNFGNGVSYSYQSCINSNFNAIGRDLGGFMSYCSNFGDEVSYSFTSCINSNFREAARQLNNQVFLPDCFNFDRKNLDYSFISCANSNFMNLERAINQR